MIPEKYKKKNKKCVIKRKLRHQNYKICVLNNEVILKSPQKLKVEAHTVYTEEINKVALSSNDDKRLLYYIIIYHRLTSCPYRTGAGKVCKKELLSRLND